MYQSLANAIMIESAKAQTAFEAAKVRMAKSLQEDNGSLIGRMEDVARTQASLVVWTKLYLIAERYKADASAQSRRLVFAANKLRDELVEEYGVLSTNPWHTAQDATNRKAKIEVYAILREFTD